MGEAPLKTSSYSFYLFIDFFFQLLFYFLFCWFITPQSTDIYYFQPNNKMDHNEMISRIGEEIKNAGVDFNLDDPFEDPSLCTTVGPESTVVQGYCMLRNTNCNLPRIFY